MEALEFKSKIKDSHILIPEKIENKLKTNDNKDVRVIVLIEEVDDDFVFQQTIQSQFLKGYADTDAIYDNY